MHVEAGTEVVRKGALGDCLYILVHGLAHAHNDDLIFNQLHPGDIFGEMAIFDAEVRSASVTTLAPTVLFRLGQQTLHAIFASHPSISFAVTQRLSQRMCTRVHDRIRDYEYIRQVRQLITAAQAVKQGQYQAELLGEVGLREDELGQLARVFRRMADQVQERELQLRKQVAELRIEIDLERQQKQVQEIVGSEYFQQLRQRAASLRKAVDFQGGNSVRGVPVCTDISQQFGLHLFAPPRAQDPLRAAMEGKSII
ncbi:MAG: hypothetical protein Fur005_17860 [Roseiflexaceae bacterium]